MSVFRTTIVAGMVSALSMPTAAWHATELGRDARSKWTTAQTVAIADSSAFRLAWADLHPQEARRPARPAVNFSKFRVLMIAAGTKPSGGYRLALTGGAVARDSALIDVTLFTPPPGCGVTQDLTSPALAIAIPRSPIAFRIITHERADTVRCN